MTESENEQGTESGTDLPPTVLTSPEAGVNVPVFQPGADTRPPVVPRIDATWRGGPPSSSDRSAAPTVGRVVLYRLADDDLDLLGANGSGNSPEAGQDVAAVVVRVWSPRDPAGPVNLRVFGDGPGSPAWLTSRTPTPTPTRGHWYWPPRV